jgi:hypothetical protein
MKTKYHPNALALFESVEAVDVLIQENQFGFDLVPITFWHSRYSVDDSCYPFDPQALIPQIVINGLLT